MRTEAPDCCPFFSVNRAWNAEENSYLLPLSPACTLAVRFCNLRSSEKQSFFLFQEEILKAALEEKLSSDCFKNEIWEKQLQNSREACLKYGKYGPPWKTDSSGPREQRQFSELKFIDANYRLDWRCLEEGILLWNEPLLGSSGQLILIWLRVETSGRRQNWSRWILEIRSRALCRQHWGLEWRQTLAPE